MHTLKIFTSFFSGLSDLCRWSVIKLFFTPTLLLSQITMESHHLLSPEFVKNPFKKIRNF